ncbi:MAG TPA: hypothetical protein VE074_15230 [Jatrophihabitantaceae bacterium]|nr:hypothetical protein [Jatrophihabitantaceae bacterium]
MTSQAVRAGEMMISRVQRAASRLTPAGWAALVGTILAIGYLVWKPLAPDLAAQIARANLVKSAGNVSWWTGWFGGLSLPTYSLLTPSSMAIFGVRATGVAAAVVGGVIIARLVATSRRPRAGAIAFSVAQMANLLDGRVTFAVGLTVAAAALLALQNNRPLFAAPLAAVAYFASPLAGLFLGLVLLAVMITDEGRRRGAFSVAVLLGVIGLSMALLFPGTGEMPFLWTDLVPAGLCCIGVALFCPQRVVRTSALLLLLALPIFLAAPGAIGNNVTRLAWICAAPVVLAYSPLRRWILAVVLALLALWPTIDVVQQVSSTRAPSSTAAFYQPLLGALADEQARGGPDAVGARLEVLDPVNHFATVYLAGRATLARGWDRQADVANDPIFYQKGGLTAASYHAWLHDLAVRWVAVPATKLDYSAVQESKLVAGGLDYLKVVWSSPSWTLYRVTDATRLAEGAQVHSVEPTRITVETPAAGAVYLRVRWSPYLTVQHTDGTLAVGSCLANADGWLNITVPEAGQYRITSRFDPVSRLQSDQRCQTG